MKVEEGYIEESGWLDESKMEMIPLLKMGVTCCERRLLRALYDFWDFYESIIVYLNNW